jgi:hypothetical protein
LNAQRPTTGDLPAELNWLTAVIEKMMPDGMTGVKRFLIADWRFAILISKEKETKRT